MTQVVTSKVDKISSDIIQLIEQKNWSKGFKLPATAVLAKQFNVSYVTVCRSLNNLQQDGWVQRRNGVGTFISGKQATTSRIRKIAIPLRVQENPFFTACYEELSSASEKHGLEIILGDGLHEAEFIDKLAGNAEIAILRFPAGPNHEVLLQKKLKQSNIKAVTLNDWWLAGSGSHHIATDEAAAINTLLTHLAENGHRHIALLDDAFNCKRINAHNAFTQWYWQQNIQLIPQQFLYFWDQNHCNNLLNLPSHKITAIICLFDILAMKTMEYLNKNNIKVPEHLSIVSFDGTRQIQDKGITSTKQNVKLLIEKALEYVTGKCNDKPGTITISAQLHKGQTVADLTHQPSKTIQSTGEVI